MLAGLQAFRGHLAILGTVLFLLFAVYGLILVAYGREHSDRVVERLQERLAGDATRFPPFRPIFAIGGLVCGFVVLLVSGC